MADRSAPLCHAFAVADGKECNKYTADFIHLFALRNSRRRYLR
jgi:hypothetical protein